MKKIRAIVSGKVQGIGFRYSTRQKAKQFGVNGYVRNLANGDVEIVATGESKPVDSLLKWAESGPTSAVVSNLKIEVLNNSFDNFSSFEIR